MPNSSERLTTVDSVIRLGSERKTVPAKDVLLEISRRSGFDISLIFDGIDHRVIEQQMCLFPEFTFIRSIEELNYISGYYPTEGFAPFGVCYGFEKKRRKRKFIDWYISVYGLCFDGQFADSERVLVWCDHAYVYSWASFGEFLNHWTKKQKEK